MAKSKKHFSKSIKGGNFTIILLVSVLLLLLTTGCSSSDTKVAGFDGLAIFEALEKASEGDYQNIRILDSSNSRDISNNFEDSSMEDASDWIVDHATEREGSSGEKTLQLYVVYIGTVEMPNLVGMPLNEALSVLKQLKCSDVQSESDNGTFIFLESNWEVISQNIEAGEQISANDTIILTCHKYEDESDSEDELDDSQGELPDSSTESDQALSYSTNDRETAKKGNTGVFAYKSNGGTYDNYWIIDLDEGYVYSFSEGNGSTMCDKVAIVSGDLNSTLVITFHDGNDSWSNGLYFKWKNMPDTLILDLGDGYQSELYPTDLNKALEIRDSKVIRDS